MKALVFLVMLVFSTASFANCYVIQNNTNYNVVLNFSYNSPVGAGTITGATVFPHHQYPLDGGQWCFNTPAGFYATVYVTGGGNHPHVSWNGALVLGNGPLARPSGVYSINP